MIGQRLAGRYEIVSELGRGGMGVVYRVRDPRLNRDVAVKLIPPSQLGPESEQRFQREAQLVAQMDHPSIVPIYDFGRHEDALYFVMALVGGTNLRVFLKEDSSLSDILAIGIQVAEALDYSHARGVVHRDIKPENIMVARQEGAGVRVRVMDFGLARAASESRMTRTGTLLGTIGYLSPEQIIGRDVDGRSDVYALGTVLYEAVVGEPPFSGEAQAVVYRIVHEFPQAPRALGATIDEALETIILDCLAKDPGKRPQRAGDVAEALERYRAGMREGDRTRTVSQLTRAVHLPKPALAPFIGRQKESAELQHRLNAAIAGECQLVLVGGEPGIGKTRLLDELEKLARARQIRVLHGRSIEQERGLPYQEFFELMLEHFRVKDMGSAPPPDLSDLAPELVSLFPMLAEIPEIRSAAGSAASLERRGTAPESRSQIFELLARTLVRIAGGRPLVLFLEELHAADVSLEALDYIVRRLGPTPVLVVGTYRSTEVHARHPLNRMIEGFHSERRAASFVLGPLSGSEHRSFLETLIGTGVADALVRKLYEGSEGNPFFTKELVRSLADSGGIARDGSGAWNLSAEAALAGDALPQTIQKAVEKRIGRLPADLRDILSVAAVIGKSFDARDLAALAQTRDIDDPLDALVEQGLIEEQRDSRGDLLSFSSGVVRDVLYAALSPRKRRSLHRRCAELLETRHAGRLERVLPQLVHHYFHGDVPEKTVEYALRLARTSLDAFSADEAVRSATSALTFLDEEWEGDRAVEGDARLLLARAQRMSGDADTARREATAAVRLFEQQRDTGRLLSALLFAAETAWQLRLPEEAGRWVEKGLPIARDAMEMESLARLLSLGATLANLAGEYDRGNALLDEAARLGTETREAERDVETPSGGRLVVAQANPVRAIEPVATTIIEESEIGATVFEPLLATDVNGHLVPWLCDRWESTHEGRVFALTLRRDVHFSDGTPLTAAGVKLSIEVSTRAASTVPAAFAAISGMAAYRAGETAGISGVVARGELELQIHLDEPLPILPALLTEGSTAVVRPVDGSRPGSTRLIGTGPFRLVSQAAERVVVERNPSYWRAGLPRLDTLEFQPSLPPAVIARRFRAGDLDLARDLLPQDLDEILRDVRLRQRLVETPKKNTYFVLFNAAGGPVTHDVRVRRALAGVVRPRDLVWRTLGRFAEPAACLIPPGMLGHDPGRRWPSLTREKALEMLRDAGMEEGTRVTASIQPLLRERAASLIAGLTAAWADVGIQVVSEPLDMPSFLATWKENAATDLTIGRWNADYDDPDNFTYTLFHSGSGALHRYFSSPEADRIVEDARGESQPALRDALYRRFESLLLDAAVLVPLFHDIDYRLASPRVRGLVLRGTKPYVNYSEIGVAPVESAASVRRAAAGIINVPMTGGITSLDVMQRTTAEHGEVLPTIFQTLTSEKGLARIVPSLAASFRVEDGGHRYRFRLREDVRFHNGRRLTARDVRYSLERLLLCPESDRESFVSIRGAKALFTGEAKDLAGFRIHSATQFTIDLEEPVAYFPALLSQYQSAIIPEGAEPSGAAPHAWVGTGPFRVAAFEPGRRLELERNKTYWRAGYPRSEGLVFHFGISPRDILSGFRDGRFSLASELLPADVDELRRQPEFASGYMETPRLVTYYLAFNTQRGAAADRALRLRLARAVDVARLVRQTLGRLAIPAHGVIPPGLLGHDPAAASRLSSGAGAPPETAAGGIELTAAVHPVFAGQYAALARELLNIFAAQGVTVRPVTPTMAEFLKAHPLGTADVYLGRWNADYPDPDTFASIFYSETGFLGRVCGSPETDRLIARARTESIPAVRHALYREFEEIVARDVMMLPLFHEQAYRIARPEVEGLSVGLGFPTVAMEDLHVRA